MRLSVTVIFSSGMPATVISSVSEKPLPTITTRFACAVTSKEIEETDWAPAAAQTEIAKRPDKQREILKDSDKGHHELVRKWPLLNVRKYQRARLSNQDRVK